MRSGTNKPIILAAGGTGGHMFPAEALARELLARGHRVELITDKRGHAFGDSLPEVPVHRIRSAAPGAGLIGKLTAGFQMGLGLIGANALLRHLQPAAVVGFGGYPSVPTVYAAAQSRVPVMLHEQNSVLGRANRMLISAARRLAVAFPEVAQVKEQHRNRIVRTGNPVRPAITALRGSGYQPPADDGPINLFVMGGSQGARIFSEAIPAALARLPAELRARIHLSQQARPEDIETARGGLSPLGLGGLDLQSFFRDVPERLANCHLAVTRAGASTIAELTCVGRPAILVPYPHAMDDHQTGNAQQLEAAGGAWCIRQADLTAEALADRIAGLLANPRELETAAGAAHRFGTGEAAARLADTVLDMIENQNASNRDTTETNRTEAAE